MMPPIAYLMLRVVLFYCWRVYVSPLFPGELVHDKIEIQLKQTTSRGSLREEWIFLGACSSMVPRIHVKNKSTWQSTRMRQVTRQSNLGWKRKNYAHLPESIQTKPISRHFCLLWNKIYFELNSLAFICLIHKQCLTLKTKNTDRCLDVKGSNLCSLSVLGPVVQIC